MPQLLTNTMKEDADRSPAPARYLADLLDGEIADIAQGDDFILGGGKSRNRVPHEVSRLPDDDLRSRTERWVDPFGNLADEDGRTILAVPPGEDGVVRDAEDPGAVVALPPERSRRVEGLEEDLGGQIFGDGIGWNLRAHVSANRAEIAPVQLAERVELIRHLLGEHVVIKVCKVRIDKKLLRSEQPNLPVF